MSSFLLRGETGGAAIRWRSPLSQPGRTSRAEPCYRASPVLRQLSPLMRVSFEATNGLAIARKRLRPRPDRLGRRAFMVSGRGERPMAPGVPLLEPGIVSMPSWWEATSIWFRARSRNPTLR